MEKLSATANPMMGFLDDLLARAHVEVSAEQQAEIEAHDREHAENNTFMEKAVADMEAALDALAVSGKLNCAEAEIQLLARFSPDERRRMIRAPRPLGRQRRVRVVDPRRHARTFARSFGRAHGARGLRSRGSPAIASVDGEPPSPPSDDAPLPIASSGSPFGSLRHLRPSVARDVTGTTAGLFRFWEAA